MSSKVRYTLYYNDGFYHGANAIRVLKQIAGEMRIPIPTTKPTWKMLKELSALVRTKATFKCKFTCSRELPRVAPNNSHMKSELISVGRFKRTKKKPTLANNWAFIANPVPFPPSSLTKEIRVTLPVTVHQLGSYGVIYRSQYNSAYRVFDTRYPIPAGWAMADYPTEVAIAKMNSWWQANYPNSTMVVPLTYGPPIAETATEFHEVPFVYPLIAGSAPPYAAVFRAGSKYKLLDIRYNVPVGWVNEGTNGLSLHALNAYTHNKMQQGVLGGESLPFHEVTLVYPLATPLPMHCVVYRNGNKYKLLDDRYPAPSGWQAIGTGASAVHALNNFRQFNMQQELEGALPGYSSPNPNE